MDTTHPPSAAPPPPPPPPPPAPAAAATTTLPPTPTNNVRQSASLRDHLNQRLAPFLKRAIKQSLVDEPEFPLRYLGEYLVDQSLQFERGSQDGEGGIRERFLYRFGGREGGVGGGGEKGVVEGGGADGGGVVTMNGAGGGGGDGEGEGEERRNGDRDKDVGVEDTEMGGAT